VVSKRRSLSKRTRFEVFKRDMFACQYCGQTPPDAILEVDHILPFSKGGVDHEANLLTSCFDCNRGKADIPLSEIHQPVTEQLREAKERALQLQAFNDFLMQQRECTDLAIEHLGLRWFNAIHRQQDKFVFSQERRQSVRVFLARLPQARVLQAMDVAMARIPADRWSDWKRWKYFCGCCWKMIRGEWA
jgi:hypothetical protein